MVGQTGHHLLWISIAGIRHGKPEDFKHNYLAPLMTGFHVPMMELPLRNTKEVLKLAGLDSNNANKTALVTGATSNPSYTLPLNLMSGLQCQQITAKNQKGRLNVAELSKAVEAGCHVMMQRTAGSGFPVLLVYTSSLEISTVVTAVQRVVEALLYTYMGRENNEATEAEVEDWLKKWKRGKEKRALVTDEVISRGWEGSAVLAIGSKETENLVMRTCGFCFLIKIE